ncbi:MAG: hypothetical protein ABII26_03480 [Pseudomonadota bacterium]
MEDIKKFLEEYSRHIGGKGGQYLERYWCACSAQDYFEDFVPPRREGPDEVCGQPKREAFLQMTTIP